MFMLGIFKHACENFPFFKTPLSWSTLLSIHHWIYLFIIFLALKENHPNITLPWPGDSFKLYVALNMLPWWVGATTLDIFWYYRPITDFPASLFPEPFWIIHFGRPTEVTASRGFQQYRLRACIVGLWNQPWPADHYGSLNEVGIGATVSGDFRGDFECTLIIVFGFKEGLDHSCWKISGGAVLLIYSIQPH